LFVEIIRKEGRMAISGLGSVYSDPHFERFTNGGATMSREAQEAIGYSEDQIVPMPPPPDRRAVRLIQEGKQSWNEFRPDVTKTKFEAAAQMDHPEAKTLLDDTDWKAAYKNSGEELAKLADEELMHGNAAQALEHLENAKNLGNASAQRTLGQLYYEGSVFPKDIHKGNAKINLAGYAQDAVVQTAISNQVTTKKSDSSLRRLAQKLKLGK
jgi:hypothetical protein